MGSQSNDKLIRSDNHLLDRSKNNIYLYLGSLVISVGLVFATFHRHYVTPSPAQHFSTQGALFSEARAKDFLINLEAVGPKLIGTPANEIGATGLLVSEIARLPTFPEEKWTFVAGLSSPYYIFHETFSHGQADSDSCVCPDQLLSQPLTDALEALINETYLRLSQLFSLCGPESILGTLGADTLWLRNIRGALRIHSTGCISQGEWAMAEFYKRYIEDSYQIQFPVISDVTKISTNQKTMLQQLAASTIANKYHLGSFSTNNICKNQRELNACTKGLTSEQLYRIERFAISKSKKSSSGLRLNEMSFIETSLSHQYSGNFTLKIAKGGEICNVYQNLTTLAIRLLPLPLIGSISDAQDILHDFVALKNEILDYFTKSNTNVFTETSEGVDKLLRSLTINHPKAPKLRKHYPPAVMLASHFDTAVSSPGGADAGTGISVSLEVLRNVLHRSSKMNRPLMLVLNGGEENVLPAAHGFIHHHPWINDVTEVFNLEAAGNWGTENLLRAGKHSQRLVQLYQKVVQAPQASSIFHDAFEAGLVPGLTDFEFYRDHADLEGFDFALGTGGYYYHTSMDSVENIQSGSIQHYGNTVSALTFVLLEEPPDVATSHLSAKEIKKLRKKQPELRDSYFDILGRYTVVLPAKFLHSRFLLCLYVFSFVFLIQCHQHRWKNASWGSWQFLPIIPCLRFTVTLASATAINALFAYALHWYGWGLCWFSNPIFVPILYCPLPIIVILESLHFATKTSIYQGVDPLIGAWKLESESFLSVMVIWMVLFTVASLTHSRAAYIPFGAITFPLLGRLLGATLRTVFGRSRTSRLVFMSSLACHFVSVIITCQPYASFVDHLGPVFGRVAPPETPDVIMSVITTIFVFFSIPLVFYSTFSGIVFDKSALSFTRKLLWCFYLPLCFSFVLSHPPFTSKNPQRVDAIHFTARSYDINERLIRAESGVTLQASDSLEFTSNLLDRFEDKFRPYWSNPADGASHFDTFHSSLTDRNVSTQRYHSTVDLKRFHVLRNPHQTFYRYPQGALFRRYASHLIHVYPDLFPPFIDPNAEGLELSKPPFVPSTWNASWQIKESNFLHPDGPLPYSSRHRPPQLTWKTQYLEKGIVRIYLTIEGSQRMIISVPFKQPVVGWSFSPSLIEPRKECDCYGIIYGGGVASPMGYDFWVDYDMKKGNLFTIAISANYFDILTPPLQTALQLEKTLKSEGTFISVTTSVGELGFWRIGIDYKNTPYR